MAKKKTKKNKKGKKSKGKKAKKSKGKKKKSKKKEIKKAEPRIIRPKTKKTAKESKLKKVINPEKKKKKKAKWKKYKKKDVVKLVLKLVDKELSQAEIGSVLRDQYGIPSVKKITKQSIGDILDEHDKSKDMPEDLYNLILRAVRLQNHLAENKGDPISRRGLELTESKIRKLARYYRRKGKLPAGWKYEPERANLLVK